MNRKILYWSGRERLDAVLQSRQTAFSSSHTTAGDIFRSAPAALGDAVGRRERACILPHAPAPEQHGTAGVSLPPFMEPLAEPGPVPTDEGARSGRTPRFGRLRRLYLTLRTEHTTPGKIALGVGIGAFVGLSPFWGLHLAKSVQHRLFCPVLDHRPFLDASLVSWPAGSDKGNNNRAIIRFTYSQTVAALDSLLELDPLENSDPQLSLF